MEEGVRREHWEEYLNFLFCALSFVKYMYFHSTPKNGKLYHIQICTYVQAMSKMKYAYVREHLIFGNETSTGKYP